MIPLVRTTATRAHHWACQVFRLCLAWDTCKSENRHNNLFSHHSYKNSILRLWEIEFWPFTKHILCFPQFWKCRSSSIMECRGIFTIRHCNFSDFFLSLWLYKIMKEYQKPPVTTRKSNPVSPGLMSLAVCQDTLAWAEPVRPEAVLHFHPSVYLKGLLG